MIRRRGFLGGLIAAAFSPAISAVPAAFSLPDAGVERMRIDAAGNVGIGDGFAWKPELRRVVPGLVEAPKGFVVQPMYKHLAALPIMAALNLTTGGVDRTRNFVTSTAPAESIPFDWNFEMISWRDENGCLTHPPEGYER